MMNLPDILAMWNIDCIIDEVHLDNASLDSAKLHGKYLELHSIYKLQLKRKESAFKVLLKNKYLWYTGKLTKSEIDTLGWEYDPLNGLKVLRGDLDKFLEADEHMQKAQEVIEYNKATVETLDEIIGNIRWRSQSIKNAIAWRQFQSGA
jgi:hypothetical protein